MSSLFDNRNTKERQTYDDAKRLLNHSSRDPGMEFDEIVFNDNSMNLVFKFCILIAACGAIITSIIAGLIYQDVHNNSSMQSLGLNERLLATEDGGNSYLSEHHGVSDCLQTTDLWEGSVHFSCSISV